MSKKKPEICCICGFSIEVELSGWRYGHNAQPVKDGRCCSDCNSMVVIPFRMVRMLRASMGIGNEQEPE